MICIAPFREVEEEQWLTGSEICIAFRITSRIGKVVILAKPVSGGGFIEFMGMESGSHSVSTYAERIVPKLRGPRSSIYHAVRFQELRWT